MKDPKCILQQSLTLALLGIDLEVLISLEGQAKEQTQPDLSVPSSSFGQLMEFSGKVFPLLSQKQTACT